MGAGHGDRVGIAAFDVLTGETRWTHTVEVPTGVDVSQYDYGYTEVLATENRVYSGGAWQGVRFPILDAQTGEKVDDRAGESYSLSVANDVEASSGDYHLSVHSYETGSSWGKDAPAIEGLGDPIIAGSTVVATHHVPTVENEEQGVYGYDLEDGSEQWQFTHPDVDIGELSRGGGFIVSGETIYVTGDDYLQALRPETDEPDEGDAEEDDQGDDDPGNDSEGEAETGEDPDEEETSDDETDEDPAEDTPTANLELSVSAPESAPYEEEADPAEDAVDFEISVTNHSDESVSVDVALEIGPSTSRSPSSWRPASTTSPTTAS